MEFVAIDVETANADMASICQIGLALYKDGQISEEWKTYINPEDYFDDFNISINGINEEKVKGSPRFPEIVNQLESYMNNRINVCHTHFDRVSIYQACSKYGISHPEFSWLDSALVARRAWTQFAWRGYGLQNICYFLGYSYPPHDALEDAKACGHVMLSAMSQTGINLEDWVQQVNRHLTTERVSEGPLQVKRDGNPQGPLYGEVIVFTGALSMPRNVAADMAAKVGCRVDDGVNKHTTLLVVGNQDIRRLAGHVKSTKHLKAEKLINEGQSIRIMREADFQELAHVKHWASDSSGGRD